MALPEEPAQLRVLQGWKTEDDGYSEYKYYSRSVDTNGHGVDVRTKIPPELHSRIMRLVVKGAIPELDSVADFMRDAIYHRLKWYDQHILNDPAFQEDLNRQLKHVELNMIMAEKVRFRDQVDNVRSSLEELAGDGDWLSVCTLLNQVGTMMDDYPEPYYGRLKALVQHYTAQLDDGWLAHLD